MKPVDLKRPAVLRLPPKSNLEQVLHRGAQISLIGCGVLALMFALSVGRFVLAPVFLAIVVGLVLGPVATRLERLGLPSWASSALVFLLFLTVVVGLAAGLTGPLSFWWGELPVIWEQLQSQLSELRAPVEALRGLQDQLRDLTGSSGLTVSIDDGSAFQSIATIAPAMGAQVLLFMASLYFFVATRHQIRSAVLKACTGRRLRWRVAHVFRDVEAQVSRYMLSIAAINLALGIAVSIGLWLAGVPSPLLWGALAGLFNFIMYIGPAIMAAILFAVGLATNETIGAGLVPVLVYLTINLIEANVVTPAAIGRTMTLNPFLVLLAIAFWIWIWGPVGGFIAIPALLIIFAISNNVMPGRGGPYLP